MLEQHLRQQDAARDESATLEAEIERMSVVRGERGKRSQLLYWRSQVY